MLNFYKGLNQIRIHPRILDELNLDSVENHYGVTLRKGHNAAFIVFIYVFFLF